MVARLKGLFEGSIGLKGCSNLVVIEGWLFEGSIGLKGCSNLVVIEGWLFEGFIGLREAL